MKELQYDVFLNGCFVFRATETYLIPLLKGFLDITFIGEGAELSIKVVKDGQNNESNTNEH